MLLGDFILAFMQIISQISKQYYEMAKWHDCILAQFKAKCIKMVLRSWIQRLKKISTTWATLQLERTLTPQVSDFKHN